MTKINWRKWADEEPKKDKDILVTVDDGCYYIFRYSENERYLTSGWHHRDNIFLVHGNFFLNDCEWAYAIEVFGDDE